jgi:hypothetical protein
MAGRSRYGGQNRSQGLSEIRQIFGLMTFYQKFRSICETSW